MPFPAWPKLARTGLAGTGVLVAVVVARFSLICTQQRSPILHVARCTLHVAVVVVVVAYAGDYKKAAKRGKLV